MKHCITYEIAFADSSFTVDQYGFPVPGEALEAFEQYISAKLVRVDLEEWHAFWSLIDGGLGHSTPYFIETGLLVERGNEVHYDAADMDFRVEALLNQGSIHWPFASVDIEHVTFDRCVPSGEIVMRVIDAEQAAELHTSQRLHAVYVRDSRGFAHHVADFSRREHAEALHTMLLSKRSA